MRFPFRPRRGRAPARARASGFGPLLLFAWALGGLGCDLPTDPTPWKRDLAARKAAARERALLRPDGGVSDGGRAAEAPPPADRSKTLVIAVDRLPRHLNPLLRISTWGYRIAMYNVYEPLLRRDPKTHRVRPHLATSWSVSPDGKVYRFVLRKDVRWHDGQPLTSRDVWYTLSRIHDRGTPMGAFRDALINDFHQVDPLAPHEVRITLANPNSFLLDHLCEVPILPYHLMGRSVRPGSRLSRRPVGTGPFRFEKWIRAKEIRLARNPNYWGHVPALERVVFRWVRSPSKALVDLKRGQVDVLPEVLRHHYPDQVTRWAQRRVRQVWFDPPGFEMILWNTRSPLLGDFRVRRALTMLIDRNRIRKEVYHGLARAVVGPFWHPAGLGDPKLEPWPFDPVRARNLLDNAGWRDRDGDKIRDLGGRPLRIVLLRPVQSQVMDDELKVMVAEFRKSGVALEPVQTAWPQMRRLLSSGRFQAAALRWNGRPAEDLSPLFHSAGRLNYGRAGSVVIDRLLTAMRRALGPTRRAQYSAQIERALHAQQAVTFLHGPRVLMLVSRRFDGALVSSEWLHLDRIRPANSGGERR